MDGWAPLVDQWLPDDFRRTGSRGRRTGSGAARRREVRRRRLEADRQALREEERASALEGSRLLPRPRLARAGSRRSTSAHAAFVVRARARDALLRRRLPLLNVGLAQVFPRRERGVRVPDPLRNVFRFVDGVPTRVVFDNATGVGRRVCDRVRTTSSSGLQRPCRFSTGSATPTPDTKGPWRTRSGRRRRNLFVPVPQCGTSTGTTRDCWRGRATCRAKGALQEGAARARAVRGRPRGDAGAPSSPFSRRVGGTRRQEEQGPRRRQALVLDVARSARGGDGRRALGDEVAVMDGDGAVVAEHAARLRRRAHRHHGPPRPRLHCSASRLGAWRGEQGQGRVAGRPSEHIDALDRRGLRRPWVHARPVRCRWDATVRRVGLPEGVGQDGALRSRPVAVPRRDRRGLLRQGRRPRQYDAVWRGWSPMGRPARSSLDRSWRRTRGSSYLATS